MFTAYISVSRDGFGFLKMALELFQPSLLRKLEEQLKETQVAKDELVAQQQELHEMMIRFKINSYIYQSSIQSMILEVDFFKHRF